MASRMSVIDADAHIIEDEQTWAYLEGADQQFRPQTVTGRDSTGADRTYWLVDGRLCPKTGGDPTIPMGAKTLADIPARLRLMDEVGVEVQVIFPSLFNHFFTKRPEAEVALCKSYNRRLADAYAASGGRLRWVISAPFLSPPDVISELEFGKAHGACGIFMRPLEGELQPADPYFFPIYEKAVELDLPICIHAANGNAHMNDFLMRANRNHYFMAITPVLGAFVEVVTTALPERFPALRMGFIEAGSQWVPYLIKEALRRRRRTHTAGDIPDEATALRDKRLFVTCRTDDDLPYVLQWTGDSNLIIGTDFGHKDAASEIDALLTLRERADLDAGVIDRIASDNARAFYGI